MRTRFAPSPTGRLHLGHVLAAKVAWSLARDAGGAFLLRHEDIDGSRVREEYYRGIEEDLHWLGLDWDGEALRQTSRVGAYEAAFESLLQRDLVYPCFCTRREIRDEWERMGEAPQGPEGPLYPGTCKRMDGAERREKLAQGHHCAWRLDSEAAGDITGPLEFTDLRHGTIPVNHRLLGDVVLSRKDIGTAYHLAVVIDDAHQEITHVTRGDDLLGSTHIHRVLQSLLNLPCPIYLHHGLMTDDTGNRLAKRCDARSVHSFREAGFSPDQVLGMIDGLFQETRDATVPRSAPGE